MGAPNGQLAAFRGANDMPNVCWRSIFILLLLSAPLAAASPDVPLAGEIAVHFATAEEGAAILSAEDDFTRSLSRFDLQCRLQTGNNVRLADWRKFASAEVRDWSDEQAKPVIESLARLRPRLEKLRLTLPKTISLVHTTGKEEAGAAYTRGSAIVLPDKVLAYTPMQLDKLLVHELFHVLSRNNPALRRDLYAIVGFRLCPPIDLPGDLADRRITNPDAPLVDCLIELADGGRTYVGAPVLYANATQYDAHQGGSLFRYLTFRLLVVEQQSGQWRPVLKDGKSVVIDPKTAPGFFEQVGKNTNYIIHPDEILADNFVHLVMENKELVTPRIVDEMAKVLAK
jgi:hypothetical protein